MGAIEFKFWARSICRHRVLLRALEARDTATETEADREAAEAMIQQLRNLLARRKRRDELRAYLESQIDEKRDG